MLVNFADLRGAYGSAERLPALLEGLWGDDPDRLTEAVNEGLWSWACHQGTMYSATPFVLEMICDGIKAIKASHLEILHFIRLCYDANDRLNISLEEHAFLKSRGIKIPSMQDVVIDRRFKVIEYINGLKNGHGDAEYLVRKLK